MNGSLKVITEKLKGWVARDGSVRWYVNDWKDMIGLDVTCYKTGNVSCVYLGDDKKSNSWYYKYVSHTKVWFDEQGEVHVDYCDDSEVESKIKTIVPQAFAEVA